MADLKKSKLWDFLLIFALITLGYQLIFRVFFPAERPEDQLRSVVMRMQDATLRLGQSPIAILENKTEAPLLVPDRCPRPPVDVWRIGSQNERTDITSGETVTACESIEAVPPGESAEISLAPWKESMFGAPGVFEIELPVTASGVALSGTGAEENQDLESIIARFEISEPGFMTQIFRAFITKPIYNALIFIASLLPGHNLAIAIIVITILIKLILFLPTQHALEGQKKMQLLQPKFEEVRKKFADDPAKMQQETMKLWKEHKVNPFQSCLPLLVQFPILIGLFYVVRDGVHLELNQYLVYPFFQDIDWTFGTHFLGFDLTKAYPWIFPPLLVVLQFIQMKLTFFIADKKKRKELEKKTTPQVDSPQEVQQRVMLYALPLMIGFFALKFPSAVSLYWGISTLFAIGQQILVNREHIHVKG